MPCRRGGTMPTSSARYVIPGGAATSPRKKGTCRSYRSSAMLIVRSLTMSPLMQQTSIRPDTGPLHRVGPPRHFALHELQKLVRGARRRRHAARDERLPHLGIVECRDEGGIQLVDDDARSTCGRKHAVPGSDIKILDAERAQR